MPRGCYRGFLDVICNEGSSVKLIKQTLRSDGNDIYMRTYNATVDEWLDWELISNRNYMCYVSLHLPKSDMTAHLSFLSPFVVSPNYAAVKRALLQYYEQYLYIPITGGNKTYSFTTAHFDTPNNLYFGTVCTAVSVTVEKNDDNYFTTTNSQYHYGEISVDNDPPTITRIKNIPIGTYIISNKEPST